MVTTTCCSQLFLCQRTMRLITLFAAWNFVDPHPWSCQVLCVVCSAHSVSERLWRAVLLHAGSERPQLQRVWTRSNSPSVRVSCPPFPGDHVVIILLLGMWCRYLVASCLDMPGVSVCLRPLHTLGLCVLPAGQLRRETMCSPPRGVSRPRVHPSSLSV